MDIELFNLNHHHHHHYNKGVADSRSSKVTGNNHQYNYNSDYNIPCRTCVTTVKIVSKNDLLISGSTDGAIKVWNKCTC